MANRRGKLEVVTDFLFLVSKITVDGDWQPWNQKTIASWQENDDKPRLCWKAETLLTKVHIVKAMVFPVVMYGCKSWTIKAEGQELVPFWLFVTPWTKACQASLSFTICGSLFKFKSIEWVMLSNHLILCHPLLLLPSVLPASGSFPMSWLFTSGGQSIRASASASILMMNIQGWFPLGLTGLNSFLSKGLLRVFSNTAVKKHQFFDAQPFLCSSSHICTWLLGKS